MFTSTHFISKVRTMLCTSLPLVAFLIIGVTSIANATPVAPSPGYNPDTGASYFTPGTDVLGFELFDILEPLSSFGFFYASDPGTTVTLFNAADPVGGGGPQITYTNFLSGEIFDVDSGVLESTFTVMPEDIGFYLSIGGATIYSDPLLNGGLDLFSASQNITESDRWELVFEGANADGSHTPINLTQIKDISTASVPEPSVLVLLALGSSLVLVGSYRRKNRC